MSPKATRRIVSACLVLAGAYAAARLAMAWHSPEVMDDSFMFYRYAVNLRHGLGVSWNPDGAHTYGETAQLWGWIVLLLSCTKLTPGHALLLGSWLCGCGAMAAMAWAVSRNAKSQFMRSIWRVLPMIAVPLIFARTYWPNALTGMETMLAAGLAGVVLGLLIGWRDGIFRPEQAAAAGLLLFLTRPEMALAALLAAAIAAPMQEGRRKELATFMGIFLTGILLDLLACKVYFHTALPLSFYIKGGRAYEGYSMTWRPLTHALAMLADCSPYIALLALFARKSDRRLVALCVIPALITFCYLLTVTQIMGYRSRYYAPYFAFFIVPALLVLDGRMRDKTFESEGQQADTRARALFLATAAAASACVVLIFGVHRSADVLGAVDRRLEGRPFEYEPVRYEMKATAPLPGVDPIRTVVGDYLLAPLPAGVSIASTETGYLGIANPTATVIDLAGLNDTQIALHGFSVEGLLARAPDIIWMPQTDYTYQRGVLLSSPLLLQQYDLYAGAAYFGIAIRKQSPNRPAIMRQMEVFWRRFYSEYPMNDYVARSVSWSGRKYRVDGF